MRIVSDFFFLSLFGFIIVNVQITDAFHCVDEVIFNVNYFVSKLDENLKS